MDSVGEGEGGKIWENGNETCKISCRKRVASPGSMHDAGCLGLVHWDDPEGGVLPLQCLKGSVATSRWGECLSPVYRDETHTLQLLPQRPSNIHVTESHRGSL